MDAEPTRRVRWVQAANLVLLVVGVGALVWMLRKISLDDVRTIVDSIRGWMIPLILLSFVSVVLNAAAIHAFMRPEQRMVSFRRVFAAQLSGQAINSVTPTGTLGEVVKVTMLADHVPRFRAVSSIVSYNIGHLIVQSAMLMLAIVVSLIVFEPPPKLRAALEVIFIVMTLLALAAVYLSRRGFVKSATQLASLLRITRKSTFKKITKKLQTLDDQMKMLRRGKRRGDGIGLAFIAAGRAVELFDLWLILTLIDVSPSVGFTVVVGAGGIVIGKLASIIPLGIGANEGGQAGLYELLGRGAFVGLSVSLIGRLRTLLIAAVGLAVMAGLHFADGARQRRAARRLRERTKT